MTTKIIVAKDEKYARTSASDTTNAAITPDLLAEGSIGIYGIHTAGSTNNNKLVLITDGGSESAGVVPASSFVGRNVKIYYGTGKDPKNINQIQYSSPLPIGDLGTVFIKSNAYSAPIRKVITIGYDSTSGVETGSLNYPSSGVERGNEVSVLILERTYEVSGFREPYSKQRYTATLEQNDDQYVAMTKLVVVFAERDEATRVVDVPKITHNITTGSVLANSANVNAVNGATSLTTTAAHGVDVGDYISLDEDYYQATTGTAGTTLVLDRPYRGVTATVLNADALDLGSTAATELGLRIPSKEDFVDFEAAVQELIETATLNTSVQSDRGSGTFAHVRDLEDRARAAKGSHDAITSYMEIDRFRADPNTTYDIYSFTSQGIDQPNGRGTANIFNVTEGLDIAFVSTVADTPGENQSDFEDIITALFPNKLTSLF